MRTENGLRTDWGASGFWEPRQMALSAVCIFNPKQWRVSFNPFIATCHTVLDNNAESYMKRLASHLSNKWNISLPRVTCLLRARAQICFLRILLIGNFIQYFDLQLLSLNCSFSWHTQFLQSCFCCNFVLVNLFCFCFLKHGAKHHRRHSRVQTNG